MAKIGVPIAIGVAAGPAGSAGYAAFQHRDWIKEHVLRRKSKPKASISRSAAITLHAKPTPHAPVACGHQPSTKN